MTQALRVTRPQRHLINPEIPKDRPVAAPEHFVCPTSVRKHALMLMVTPQRTGCNLNCSQGQRCTCTGAPMPRLSPRAAYAHPSRLEQRASDFGALDLQHKEDPDPSAADINEQLRPRDALMARFYRWGWRVALVAAALIWITGCGGADTQQHQQQFEPALRPPQDTPQPSSKPHRAQRTDT